MSRIFKAPRVNIGQPYEVNMVEKEAFEDTSILNIERSSDLAGLDPDSAASAIIQEAKSEATEIIEVAKLEAQNIITNANENAGQIQDAAREQGYNEGYARGLGDGKRETEDLANEALQIKEELEIERASLVEKVETQVIDLILQTVKKIVGNELATREDIICDVVIKALNKIGSGENINVKVSQDDFKTLDENKINVTSKCDNVMQFDIKEDLALKKGDCLIETDCGTIDAGVDTQLDKFETIITETMGIDNDAK